MIILVDKLTTIIYYSLRVNNKGNTMFYRMNHYTQEVEVTKKETKNTFSTIRQAKDYGIKRLMKRTQSKTRDQMIKDLHVFRVILN